MADDDNNQPIIIRRVHKGGHGGHHGGSWKVAFADFMTAMMAFFLVMWLVGQEDRVKEAVAGYFRDPGKFQKEGGAGVLKGSVGAIPSKDIKAAESGSKSAKEFVPSKEEKQKLSSAAKSLLAELERQTEFKKLRKNIKMQMTSEGLRIILNESESSPAFFEPGSAKLLQKSAVILVTIAKELGQLSNRVVIEGHTDASYGGTGVYTNWELSVDRANAARQLMEVSGLYEGQIREVRGFADKFPMIVDNPGDARNRRVSLVVLYKARERLYDQIEVGNDLLADIP
ncbi:MAG: OmpA family protein [candidate division Zixibacteria bacterium]|nr:OmpA family protein [candidate division Zixibacteria bacterium]